MRTPPADLSEAVLLADLQDRWSLSPAALTYRPVGFGSHHWDLTDDAGVRWFVTVDDLRIRRRSAIEPLSAGYERLRAALAASIALGTLHDFVVAPVPTHDGQPVTRLGDCFALAVYPFVEAESFDWGDYTRTHRFAVVDLLVSVHSAPAEIRDCAMIDDFAIPLRERVIAVLDGVEPADPARGPYERPAGQLIVANAPAVRHAFARYDDLVGGLRTNPPELVLTHGEPHPGNSMCANGKWLLIDWDTTLVAPPERDLWDLDPGDGTLHATYAAATGRTLRSDVVELYRLRWDLTELAVDLAWFQSPHGSTADDEETWTNLGNTLTQLHELTAEANDQR